MNRREESAEEEVSESVLCSSQGQQLVSAAAADLPTATRMVMCRPQRSYTTSSSSSSIRMAHEKQLTLTDQAQQQPADTFIVFTLSS